jgi:hypothetical protein
MVILLPRIVSWNKESVIVMLALWSLGLDRNCRGQMSRVGSYGTYSTLCLGLMLFPLIVFAVPVLWV